MISLRHIYSNFTEEHPRLAYAYAGIPNLYVLPAGVTIEISYYTGNQFECTDTESISFACKKPLLISVDYVLAHNDMNDVNHATVFTYPEFVMYNNKIINPEQFNEFDGKNVFYVNIRYEGNEKYVDNAIYLDDNIECNKLYKNTHYIAISSDDIHNLFNLCNYMYNSEFPYLI